MKDLNNYRKSYEKSQLEETAIPNNPIVLFSKWFDEAESSGVVDEVNAMSLSTIGLDGFPKSRIVLLKEFSQHGFVFYTNYNSEKGRSIEVNSKVCLSFFWPEMERQVIIKGNAAKTAADVSDRYFDSRPEGSRLGAIVSNQSEVISSRAEIEGELERLSKFYVTHDIKRPGHWGGYCITPESLEFWQGRANRLHDRIIFHKDASEWKTSRLAP